MLLACLIKIRDLNQLVILLEAIFFFLEMKNLLKVKLKVKTFSAFLFFQCIKCIKTIMKKLSENENIVEVNRIKLVIWYLIIES